MEADLLLDLMAAAYPQMKFWISFQCKDGKSTAHDEPYAAVVNDLWARSQKNANHENLIAIGVNCTQPIHVAPLFRSVNEGRSKDDRIPLIAYPNSGEVFDTSNE